MLEYLKLALTNPEVESALAQVIVALVGAVFTVVAPLALRTFNKLSFVKIEEKHAKSIQNGIQTWAENAIVKGLDTANEAAYQDMVSYLKRTYPDAMEFLHPTGTGLRNLLTRYLNRAKD